MKGAKAMKSVVIGLIGFYESPDDIHAVGHNASSTKPAKFIVFLVKDKETPLLSPAQ
jgi:hypothetical protein